MSSANHKIKLKDFHATTKKFIDTKFWMNVLSEYSANAMDIEIDKIKDKEADKLINEMTHEFVIKKQRRMELEAEIDLDGLKNLDE